MAQLRGVFAAAVTPMLDGGTRIDEPGIGHVAEFLAEGGADGALVCGTAGEGMLLAPAERMRALEAYLAAAGSRLAIMAHCGAQIDRRYRRPRRARGRGRRRRRVGHRPALLPARRARAARASRGGSAGLLPAAVLHLRVHGSQRLSHPAAGDRAARGARLEPRRAQGLRAAVGALRAVPDRRARRLRRAGGADRARARRRRHRRDLRARIGVPGARRRGREQRDARGDGTRQGGTHGARALPDAVRAQDTSARCAACRSRATCAPRCAHSTRASAASSRAPCAACSRLLRHERPAEREGDRRARPARQRHAAEGHPRGRAQPPDRQGREQARHAPRRSALRRRRDVRELRRGARATQRPPGCTRTPRCSARTCSPSRRRSRSWPSTSGSSTASPSAICASTSRSS